MSQSGFLERRVLEEDKSDIRSIGCAISYEICDKTKFDAMTPPALCDSLGAVRARMSFWMLSICAGACSTFEACDSISVVGAKAVLMIESAPSSHVSRDMQRMSSDVFDHHWLDHSPV